MQDKIDELRSRRDQALKGGGEERILEQIQKGKLFARERIHRLLDKDTFTELYMFAEHQCHDFGMDRKHIPGDGVVTGHGLIGGRRVFVYAHDATVFGGSVGAVSGKKIVDTIALSRDVGAPLIGLIDSAGARIQEGMDNVRGYARIFYEHVQSAGVVPQLSAIMGNCSGGASYSPALTDFVFQVDQTSRMFLTGPEVIRQVTGEVISFEDLGGARIHTRRSGVSHFFCKNDTQCLEQIRTLLTFLPQNNREHPPGLDTGDDPKRPVPAIEKIIPTDMKKSYDVRDVIRKLADRGDFLEVHELFARNMVIGFARLAGRPVGIVANQPKVLAGAIDIDASDKAARFIRFCDAFNFPLVTLVDNPGYLPGTAQEYGGIIRHGAKMLYAYSESTVPKISLVLRKAYGGGISAMCPKEMGTDQMFVLPTAEIAVVGAEPAVDILFRREIASAEDPESFRKTKIAEYRNAFCTPYHSASRQLVDAVIEPAEARAAIVGALLMLESKSTAARPWKKHGTIPL
ncbi:MAG: acyl-CoA carboxylase subunit beta [Deltaproteobacteria bacterium]|nr:acyl-CoA carboxylase subunit beta [Deltaproteobacteria bacterium]